MNTSWDEIKTQVESFHDAVLLGIEMHWAEGTVTIGIRAPSGPKRIIVAQVTRLECPREYPWGRSVCINEIRFGSPAANAAFRMDIEMQSGDVLVICGSSVGVEQGQMPGKSGKKPATSKFRAAKKRYIARKR